MNQYYSAVQHSKQTGEYVDSCMGLRERLAHGLCVRRGGALFFAVVRGKVSEGLDFSDENARGVIIVGMFTRHLCALA
jgi:hypothetical protein